MTDRNDDPASPPGATDDFASMFAQFEKEQGGGGKKKQRGPRPGDQVKGRIVSIGQETLFVDLGGKSEGALSLLEVRDEDGNITVNVGDEIEARVTSTEDGQIQLRRVLGRGKEAHSELQQAFELGIAVEGLVTGVNKGGVEVNVAGARAFCPISQLDAQRIENADSYIGQRLSFRITRFEAGQRGRENIVLSRRSLVEEEQRARAVETRARLQVGAVVSGKVTTLKDYGAFVDLGGLEGMLHVSEMGFSRVSHPKDLLSVGQQVEVQIIKIEKGEDPRRPEKISLSLKSLEKDPWGDVEERFPVGARVKGKVVRVEQFGAFVELGSGIEGLAHISELAAANQKSPKTNARQMVKVGQEIEVTVLAIEKDKHRISLSANPPDEHDERNAEVLAGARTPAKSFGTFGDLLKGSNKK